MITSIAKPIPILLLTLTLLLQIACQETNQPPPEAPSTNTPPSTLSPTATPLPTPTPTTLSPTTTPTPTREIEEPEEPIEGVDLCTQKGCSDGISIEFSQPLDSYTLSLEESPTKKTVFWCPRTDERRSSIPRGNVAYFPDRTQVKDPSRWDAEIPERWPELTLCDDLPLHYGTAEWDPATALSSDPIIWHARAFCGEPIETQYEGRLPDQRCEANEIEVNWNARQMPAQFNIVLYTEFGTVELGQLPEIEPYFPNGETCDQDYFCRRTVLKATIPTPAPDSSE